MKRKLYNLFASCYPGIKRRNQQFYLEHLSSYDVISFDIFDTLIFRPFSEPADLFFFAGEKLGVMNFKEIRRLMEKKEREACAAVQGHYEVTLEEIWKRLEKETGIPAEVGMQVETGLEKKFCYANPFMLEVFQKLLKQGKKIIIVSDMYLTAAVLEEILCASGFSGYEKLYVSCEYKKSKADGSLFALVRRENPGSIVHVGDNRHSDVTMAKRHGLVACHYPNVNVQGMKYRPQDMSPVIGGAYRGVVNNYLYHGNMNLSMEQEYGFIYGGLFVTGYCSFIHEYCRLHQVDKVLFLSRDGDILKQAYAILFPGEKTEYVYWSRKAATKLMAGEDKYDYYRRFLYHKINQRITLEKIFAAMGLDMLAEKLEDGLEKSMLLTDRNVEKVKAFLEENWAEVLNTYAGEQEAAKAYYAEVLADCKKAVAVDIGWAGSGAVALDHLAEKVWKLPCKIIGLVAGTNTRYNSEPDASEMFLQTGKLNAYLYSQSFNRDLMKKHNPGKNYNVYWELLLASPTPQFFGFCKGDEEKAWKLVFGAYDANLPGIREIQKGILDFVEEYKRHFGSLPFMYDISGRDAYAPMLVAAGNGEKYLRKLEERFSLEVNIG